MTYGEGKVWTFKGFLNVLAQIGIMVGMVLGAFALFGGAIYGLYLLSQVLIAATNFVIGLIVTLVIVFVLFALILWFFKGDDAFDG